MVRNMKKLKLKKIPNFICLFLAIFFLLSFNNRQIETFFIKTNKLKQIDKTIIICKDKDTFNYFFNNKNSIEIKYLCNPKQILIFFKRKYIKIENAEERCKLEGIKISKSISSKNEYLVNLYYYTGGGNTYSSASFVKIENIPAEQIKIKKLHPDHSDMSTLQ